jgi:hypothetical protein
MNPSFRRRSLSVRRILISALAAAFIPHAAAAADKPYQVEWVYHVKYGHQAEWWKIFQKYQVAILDREKRLGLVSDYHVDRPGLHASEDARWDYRIIITYPSYEASQHEGEVERQLFPDRTALNRDENRRWELTLNHWDLPIRQADPHGATD